MNDPLEILDLMAERAREIPELVALVSGDAQRIEAWHPQWPEKSSVIQALSSQDEGTVRFIYQRTGAGRDGAWWRHEYVVQFRPAAERGADEYGGQVKMARALVNGKTASGGRWLHHCFRPNTDAPMTVTLAPRVFAAPGGQVYELFLGSLGIWDREA